MNQPKSQSQSIPQSLIIRDFYHQTSGTLSYLVYSADSKEGVVIDPVLDYDADSATCSTGSLETILAVIQKEQIQLHYILETHAHADHLSGAQWLKEKTAAQLVIGQGITQVQTAFKNIYNLEANFNCEGKQFDQLLEDGQKIQAGSLTITAMATPGHTSDSMTYLIGDAAFIGDTLFAPDLGTARCDFPGGNAVALYQSIQKLLALPKTTRLFLCHDYPEGREALSETSIAAQRNENILIGNQTSEKEFVVKRKNRDAQLDIPKLLIPAVQINIRAGEKPPAEDNGVHYLKVPLDQFKPPIKN